MTHYEALFLLTKSRSAVKTGKRFFGGQRNYRIFSETPSLTHERCLKYLKGIRETLEMKNNYERVFLPRKRYSCDQAEEGKWTDFIKERFKGKISFHFDEIRLAAASPEVDELISLFEREKGFKPFSYLQGRYKYSKLKPSPFKFFRFSVKDGGTGQGLRMADDINFENQMACDYPANPIMVCGNNGCGRWKKQISPFRLAKKPGRKIPTCDFFDFWAGSRLPEFRIYGISAKAREAILQYGITGCEIQPILSYEREALSNIYQLTITGETCGAFPTEERLSDLKSCSACGYTPPLSWFELLHSAPSIIPDSFFRKKTYRYVTEYWWKKRNFGDLLLAPCFLLLQNLSKCIKNAD